MALITLHTHTPQVKVLGSRYSFQFLLRCILAPKQEKTPILQQKTPTLQQKTPTLQTKHILQKTKHAPSKAQNTRPLNDDMPTHNEIIIILILAQITPHSRPLSDIPALHSTSLSYCLSKITLFRLKTL